MKILAFGEILFDIFEHESKIGGAPLNFAAHFSKLGGKSYLLSAVGKDAHGCEARSIAASLGVRTDYLITSDHRTGFCKVGYDKGEPVYDLSAISAFDHIEPCEEEFRKIEREKFDILYFGTLAQRSEASQNTLNRLLDRVQFETVFFDMNLRQSYYDREIIETSLMRASIVKLNRSELKTIKAMKLCHDEKDLCKRFSIEKLLLTLDKEGMVLYDALEDAFYPSSKPKNPVVSTVGAGDASGACFLYNYLKGVDLQVCVERANILGDYIVTFPEAVPAYSEELRQELNLKSEG